MTSDCVATYGRRGARCLYSVIAMYVWRYGMLSRLLSGLLACFCVVFAMTLAQAQQVQLGWNTPLQADGTPLTDLASYRLYVGSRSGHYETMVPVGMATEYTVTNLSAGQTYCFAIKASTTAGIESVFSNEVSITLRSPRLLSQAGV